MVDQLSFALESFYYSSKEIYEQEKESIFYRTWQYACHKSQLPEVGNFLTINIASEEIFLIRDKDQQIKAFYNVCPHRAHPLVSGSGTKQMIVCPYHAWSFFTNGSLCNARGSKNVAGFEQNKPQLSKIKVEEFLGFIFVNLDPDAVPLKSQTGSLEAEIRDFVPEIDNLVFAHRIPYDIKANWKVVIDNYLECYHCPPTHPDFVDLVDLKSYRSKTYGIYSSHIARLSQAKNSAYCISSSNQPVFGGWWLWPNISFTVFPGKSNITVMNMMGRGIDRTVENFDFFFLNKTPDQEEQAAIDYIYEKLQPEDVLLVENVQKGLQSRAYKTGPLIIDEGRSEMSEHALLHFHSLFRKAIDKTC